ncbi:MAG: hypothetical protein WBZ36_26840, partial [Candidatus Nitrosopolaris sp.]
LCRLLSCWFRGYALTRQNMLAITFAALITAILSNFWLLTNVSYAVPLSSTKQLLYTKRRR